jgi:uncharacterized protein (DUF2141 family)
MFKKILFLLVVCLLCLLSCAKRGAITGGLKDTLAPVVVNCEPKNLGLNFDKKTIKINFDEYIVLKDVNKQLIVSPPMKQEPLVMPTWATKQLTIKIIDTLQPNTTYSFNFGQSIEDNNEGNALKSFKYLFSTGSYIDSLSISGYIKDAFDKTPETYVSVMLYEVNDKFNDSIIYKKKPNYITNTLDSLSTFKLENIKEGKYLLMALKDNNSNATFDPKSEKVGFLKQYIQVPNDTLFELELFKETQALKINKPIQASNNKLIVGYTGKNDFENYKPEIIIRQANQVLVHQLTRMQGKDSLQIWFKDTQLDSINIEINHQDYQRKHSITLREIKNDSLKITNSGTEIIEFNKLLLLNSNTPIVAFDKQKMKLTKADDVNVPFEVKYDEYNQQFNFDFVKEPSEKYNLKIEPLSIIDYLGNKNDSLNFDFSTKSLEEVGNIAIQLQKVKSFPVIIELTNDKGTAVYTQYSNGETAIEFNKILPQSYSLRVIYDTNSNKVYDTGNYLEKRYSEEVIYFQNELNLRANWDINQDFDLSIPYVPQILKNKTDRQPPKRTSQKNQNSSQD